MRIPPGWPQVLDFFGTPLVITCADNDQFVMLSLRPGNVHAPLGADNDLRLEGGEQLVEAVLGVAEEHHALGVVIKVVVDAGEAGTHAAFQNND